MNGSEKQIKWAEEIKAAKAEEFAKLYKAVRNDIGTKAISYIESNDNVAFWIDNRDRKVADLLNQLCRGGLAIKGDGFAVKALLDMQTGAINLI